MCNDPSRPLAGKDNCTVGRSATLAGYAIFVVALTIVLAVLLGDRRSIANATRGVASMQADHFGIDDFVSVLTDEPAIPPLDAFPRPGSKPVSRAELDQKQPR
jgi:hypothetical protein